MPNQLGKSFRASRFWLISQAHDLVFRHLRSPAAQLLTIWSWLMSVVGVATSARSILLSSRLAPHRPPTNSLRRLCEEPLSFWRNHLPDDVLLRTAAARSIVIRAPHFDDDGRVLHKGILIVKFTETFPYFAHRVDLDRVHRLFRVVLEPSWAGYALPEILFWTARREPVIVQASDGYDRALLSALNTSLVPVPYGASDWVNPAMFRPLGLPKTFNAVCIANCTIRKRAIAFASAVRKIRRTGRSFKAALVLAQHGTYRSEIEDVIDLSGVRDSLTVYDSLPHEKLNEVLNRASCNVLLSLKEGSNKSIFEGFFADVPAIVLKENIGVNKDYLVPETGLLANERGLPEALCIVADNPDRFHPRRWALGNISPSVTTSKLLATLQSLGDGESPEPVRLKVNAPEPSYLEGINRQQQTELNIRLLTHLNSASNGARLTDHEALRPLVVKLRGGPGVVP